MTALGTVTWLGDRAVATLVGVDRWTVAVDGRARPDLAGALADLYAGRFRGPEWGHYGQGLLRQVAADLGGTAAVPDPPPAEPGVLH